MVWTTYTTAATSASYINTSHTTPIPFPNHVFDPGLPRPATAVETSTEEAALEQCASPCELLTHRLLMLISYTQRHTHNLYKCFVVLVT